MAWHATSRRETSARPEEDLLLCCAQIPTDITSTAQIKRLVQQPLDWEYLLRMAQRHALLPLLFWHLNATCPEAVPTTYWQRLRERFNANARRNLRLTGELLTLVRLCAAEHIPLIPFKGPVLAASVYGDLALRQFGDLDILVPAPDVLRMKTLLLAHGYRMMWPIAAAQERLFLKTNHEYSFIHRDGVSCVDLHWSLSHEAFPTPLDPQRLWEGLVPVMLGGREVLTFTPEDTLLLLCMHGAKHCWDKVQLIGDVARLLTVSGQLDWERVLRQAQTAVSVRPLYLGLRLAHDLLGCPLPEDVWHRVQADPVVPRMVTRVRARFFQQQDTWPMLVQNTWRGAQALDTLRQRSRYVCEMLFTPTLLDFVTFHLPALFFPLYYVLKPCRLSATYLLTPLKHQLLKRFQRS